jgi:(2Fe-2S) ferredoxin
VDEALIDRIVDEHLAGGQPVASHSFHRSDQQQGNGPSL